MSIPATLEHNVVRGRVVTNIALVIAGSIIIALADLGRVNTNTGTIVIVVYLALQVIVLYALLIDPATRRNFAGKAT